jgi:hypothetical protein
MQGQKCASPKQQPMDGPVTVRDESRLAREQTNNNLEVSGLMRDGAWTKAQWQHRTMAATFLTVAANKTVRCDAPHLMKQRQGKYSVSHTKRMTASRVTLKRKGTKVYVSK